METALKIRTSFFKAIMACVAVFMAAAFCVSSALAAGVGDGDGGDAEPVVDSGSDGALQGRHDGSGNETGVVEIREIVVTGGGIKGSGSSPSTSGGLVGGLVTGATGSSALSLINIPSININLGTTGTGSSNTSNNSLVASGGASGHGAGLIRSRTGALYIGGVENSLGELADVVENEEKLIVVSADQMYKQDLEEFDTTF